MEAEGALGPIITMVLMSAFILFMVVAHWKLFTKAGHPGWSCLVPIYNIIVMLKMAGKPGWWFLLMLVPVANFIVPIIMIAGITKNFGKGTGFLLGLLFLPMIFLPILAFGSAEYHLPQENSNAAPEQKAA